MAIDFSQVVDPDDELFWKEIKHAATQVTLNHGVSFTIERGTNKVEVFWAIDETDEPIDPFKDEYLVIEIRTVEPKQPALMVP